MTLDERIVTFSHLGEILTEYADKHSGKFRPLFDAAIQRAIADNYWFTEDGILSAINAIADKMLDKTALVNLTSKYPVPETNNVPKNIGLIMAGNIPLVGFHDLLCVLISGNRAFVKPSSKDSALILAVCEILVSINPKFDDLITVTDKRPEQPDAVIATGSNNSARYFEAAYGTIPCIIRKNRYSAAILSGDENKSHLQNLGKDIFEYFGLGCRNVSCLLTPDGYEFKPLFDAIAEYGDVIKHEAYRDCYRYRKAVFDLHEKNYITNGFVLLSERNASTASLAAINYVRYFDLEDAANFIRSEKDKIQCVVSNILFEDFATVPFGKTQSPEIDDYADGVDTLRFLLSL